MSSYKRRAPSSQSDVNSSPYQRVAKAPRYTSNRVKEAAFMAVSTLEDELAKLKSERYTLDDQFAEATERHDRTQSQLEEAEAALVAARVSFKKASRCVTAEQTSEERRTGSLERVEQSLERMTEMTLDLKSSTTYVRTLRAKVLARRGAVSNLAYWVEKARGDAEEMERLVFNAKASARGLGRY